MEYVSKHDNYFEFRTIFVWFLAKPRMEGGEEDAKSVCTWDYDVNIVITLAWALIVIFGSEYLKRGCSQRIAILHAYTNVSLKYGCFISVSWQVTVRLAARKLQFPPPSPSHLYSQYGKETGRSCRILRVNIAVHRSSCGLRAQWSIMAYVSRCEIYISGAGSHHKSSK